MLVLRVRDAPRRLPANRTHTVWRHHFTCGRAFGVFAYVVYLPMWHKKGYFITKLEVLLITKWKKIRINLMYRKKITAD